MKDLRFHPAQVLAVSFLAAILVGTALLSLPLSTRAGALSPIDALFTSTSAVCVTGLIVKDTPVDFTPAGQAILLALIQLGGLGIMTFSTLVLLVAGRNVSIRDRLQLQSSYHAGIPQDFRALVRSLFTYTVAIELAGAAALFFCFWKEHGPREAVPLSVFHSVSAFCNAGFSLFSDSFAGYRGHVCLNITVMALILLGGIGFPVLREARDLLADRFNGRKLHASLHFKFVLSMSGALILFSSAFIFLQESKHGLEGLSAKERVLGSFFQAVTARTAGFNTVEIGALSSASVLLLLVLMFVGASPASTGGGVKTSTAGVILMSMRARLRAQDSVMLFKRTLPPDVITKAFTLAALAIAVIFLCATALLVSQPALSLREAIFEAFSAFGTVGLSMGITPNLTTAGKLAIIFTMFIGRVGPLTLLYAFSRQRAKGHYEYAEEPVLIG
jgi:trk system potassium uptake protein TrkH